MAVIAAAVIGITVCLKPGLCENTSSLRFFFGVADAFLGDASTTFLISSSVILTCAQRLMRRICSHCKEPVTYPAKMYQDLNIDPSMFDGVTLHRGRGCDRCKNTGYSGRLAIIEAMTVTDEIRRLIISRSSAREMGKVALGQGMRTLRMIALDRVREGASTLEQVLVLTSAN